MTVVSPPSRAPHVSPPVRGRLLVAFLALLGLLVASYLTLYKIGIIGSLACGLSGSCERVQTSRWATMLGVPVAAYGVGGYLAILLVALAGTTTRWRHHRAIAAGLAGLCLIAFLVSMALTALEAFVIHAWCAWCVTSAVIATLLFLVTLNEWALLVVPHETPVRH